MRTGHSDGKLLEFDSVIVQNSSLKQTLSEVFNGYQGITTSLKKLVFKAPFHPFYHQWNQFSDILERQKKEDHHGYLYSQLLYKVLYAELRGEMDEIKDHTEQGIVTFKLLWALFEPGSLLFSLVDGKERFFLSLAAVCIYQVILLCIPNLWIGMASSSTITTKLSRSASFLALRTSQTDLPIYPFHFHPSTNSVIERAIERGRKFQELQGIHYKAYPGPLNLVTRHGQDSERKVGVSMAHLTRSHSADRLFLDRRTSHRRCRQLFSS